MRTARTTLVALALFVLVPAIAFAQASITGVVKDTSGAVLPGVTVEASSPDLIEKSRVATTDEGGRYRIVDLRTGTYTVTFSLTGFSSVKREGIQLSGSFTATIDAELKLGALQETVTVTGESPLVDVQSVRRQTVIDSDVITSIPVARSYNSLMQLMPNTVTQAGSASDVQTVPGMVVFGGAGGPSNEGRLNVDGISVGSAFNGAGVSSYIPDVGNAREVTMIASGGLGETEGGGPSLNIVPKEGGNSFRGSAYLSGVSQGMVGSNYTDALKSRGLTVPGQLRKIWDYTGAIGGPILRDRLWFFSTARDEGSERGVAGMFANKNAGDPTKFTYEADTTRPAVLAASYRIYTTRATLQATPRNKVTFYWDEQRPCEGGAAAGASGACRTSGSGLVYAGSTAPPTPSASAVSAPETAAFRDFGNRVVQAKWTSPLTNRVLLEAGYGTYHSNWGGHPIPGLDVTNLTRITEQCAVTCVANGNIPGLTYRSLNWSENVNWNTQWSAAMSWVTGGRNIKVGYQGALLYDNRQNLMNSTSMSFRTNNGVPDQLTENITGYQLRQRVRSDAFYGQEQWTIGRATLQGALRYDHAWSYFPEQTVGPARFFPTAVTYQRTTGVKGYNDLWPRGGVAYDLFGTGKTSLKVNFGRYLEAAQNGGFFTALNPTGRLSTSASRAWSDANGNWVPDCNLLNPSSQDLRASGGDLCGAITNPNFGTPVFDSTLDPSLLSGWGVRSGDWQWGASIQQQVLPRVALEVSYQRRWLVNFAVTDNRARAPEDFTQFSVVAPADSRLPNGGGYTVGGLYNVTPIAAARLNDNFQTLAKNYADQKQLTNSISLNVTARPRAGLAVQGGFNTAKTNSDSCALRQLLPEIATNPPSLGPVIFQPFCETSTGWVTRFTGLATYTVPKIDVLLSGTMRSDQGSPLSANWAAPNSATVGLNRPFAGIGGQTLTLNLIEPGTLYGDRVNEIDLRFAKILRFGRTRSNVGVDLYNAFNRAPVLTYNQTFSPLTTTWLRPTSVLQARYVKVSAQIDF